MGISHRLWDDGVFVPPGHTPPPPSFVGQLLSRLGADILSDDDKYHAIENWLKENEPSESLKMSLRKWGYDKLLD